MTTLAPDVAARTNHPAKFPNYLLDQLTLVLGAERRLVDRPLRILDPFAGVGRIHDLPRRLGKTYGVELEPEWAACRKGTIVGDATSLPSEWTCRFDAVVTSPCYGNRMSDHHDAKDACFDCGGTGVVNTPDGCGDAPMICGDCHSIACSCGGHERATRQHVAACVACRARRCSNCNGRGVSKRYTYRHALDRELSDNNAGAMQWGVEYRALHERAWREARRVLRPNGLILVNVKNHIRGGTEQFVVEWHELCLKQQGFDVLDVMAVKSVGMRNGANRGLRVDSEQIIVGRAK